MSAKSLVPEDPATATTENGRIALSAKRTSRVITMTDLIETGKPVPARGSAEWIADSMIETATLDLKVKPEQRASIVADLETRAVEFDRGYDLTLIATTLVRPIAKGESGFVPGRIAGTLYLWSRADHAIVCAAPVAGHGSKSLTLHGTGEDAWFGNLIESAVIDALPRMVAVQQ